MDWINTVLYVFFVLVTVALVITAFAYRGARRVVRALIRPIFALLPFGK